MKKISLDFVEYKVFHVSIKGDYNRLFTSVEMDYFYLDDFVKVKGFEDKLKTLKQSNPWFEYKKTFDFNLISQGSWIDYELPALIATTGRLNNFPSKIISTYMFGNLAQDRFYDLSIKEFDESLLALFPEPYEECKSEYLPHDLVIGLYNSFGDFVCINHAIYCDLIYEADYLGDLLYLAILERPK